LETNRDQKIKFTFTVPEELNGERLDKVVGSIEQVSTRSRAAHLIELGLVKLNEKVLKPSYKVITGDVLNIQLPEPPPTELLPFEFELEILFEDSDVIVINKPSGLVVHPAAGHHNDTLVNALIHHSKDLSMKFGENRPGIVHRLDKETSGVMVVAKNDFAHESLTKQFKQRSIHRQYLAVVHGLVSPANGRIQSFLARHPIHRKKFSSVRGPNQQILRSENPEDCSEGKWAATNYKTLQSSPQFTYLSLKLETGRTHQIRVHMSEMGHPIVGDTVYGADKKLKNISVSARKAAESLNRFLLHAHELSFDHPKTNERLHFSAPWDQATIDLAQVFAMRLDLK
jgi:23S rRNA pseudouridine1911/1915/1917 synthase